ncbi:MAG: peroxiredoxin family protein [Planctomycetaceae bacterium]
MHAFPLRPALIVLLLAAAGGPATAQNMQITTADIELGPHVSGPEIAAADLAGRVVVLEFWGIHCPPCIASMPHLESAHKQLGPQGLLVIGAHAQGGKVADVRKTVAELDVTFPIVANATVSNGMDFRGIPHCMVFDHTGACVYRGSPTEADEIVAKAVQAAPGAVLGGRSLVKLAAVGQMLKNEAQWGAVIRKLQPLVASKDEEMSAEAGFVLERLEARGREMLEQARGLAASDPFAAAALAQRCGTAFKGGDLGKDATALIAEWKKDRAFQAAFKAGQQLAKLEALQGAAANVRGPLPPQVAGQAREMAKAIENACPGADYAAKAHGIVAALEQAGQARPQTEPRDAQPFGDGNVF